MEKRVVIFLVLSLAIILFYPLLLEKMGVIPPPVPPSEDAIPSAGEEQEDVYSDPVRAPSAVPELHRQSGSLPAIERDIVVETDLYRAVFSSRGGVIKSWTLKRYLSNDTPDPQPIDLVPEYDGVSPQPLAIRMLSSDDPDRLSTPLYRVEGGGMKLNEYSPTGELTFWYHAPETGVSVAKRLAFSNDSYLVNLEIETTGISDASLVSLGTNFGMTEWNETTFIGFIGPATAIDGKIDKADPDMVEMRTGILGWVALQDKYFISALIPKESFEGNPEHGEVRLTPLGEKQFSAGVVIDPSKPVRQFQLYAGPKAYKTLQTLNIGLEDTIDFGWFIYGSWALVRGVAKPLFYVLNALYDYTHNYGLAIILLTVGVKVLFAPLMYKSYVSMKAMAKLQPKMLEIQKKYKNDREKLNQEVMNLYRTEKVNPVGGCLPMLLQMPVFIALFNILYMTVELRQAPFVFWIKDLSAPDPFFVVPILMGVTMFIQQKIQPTPMDPRQAKIMLILPFVLTFMFLHFASGLVLYWLTNNVLTIAQQYLTERFLIRSTPRPVPDSAEVVTEASTEDVPSSDGKGRQKGNSKKSRRQRKRSAVGQ